MDYLILPYTTKEKKDKRWIMDVINHKIIAHDISAEVAIEMVKELKNVK